MRVEEGWTDLDAIEERDLRFADTIPAAAALELCEGPSASSYYRTDDERRVAWLRDRDTLIAAHRRHHPGTRPWAFWHYEARREPPTAGEQLAYLRVRGLIGVEERRSAENGRAILSGDAAVAMPSNGAPRGAGPNGDNGTVAGRRKGR